MASVWPAAIVDPNGPWQNRFTSGITRRANSVLAVGEPADVASSVANAEQFYRRHGLPAVFQASEASTPSSLEPHLLDRGYISSARTSMLWATVDDVLATAVDDAAACSQSTFSCSPSPEANWFETYRSVEQARISSEADVTVVCDQLLAPESPALFISAHLNNDRVVTRATDRATDQAVDPDASSLSLGSPALGSPSDSSISSALESDAVVQLVIQGDWGCVQCLATRATSRRQGLAGGLIMDVAQRAKERGVTRLYAAVMVDNEASNALFQRASFVRSHDYSYFSQPLEAG